MELLILTRVLGYKLPDVRVNFEYHVEEVSNDFAPHLLGDTYEHIVFDAFKIEPLGEALLATEYMALKQTIEQALVLVKNHLEGAVRSYLRTGDTLTKGAGILGKHQTCYVIGSEAHTEMIRCQEWSKKRFEAKG